MISPDVITRISDAEGIGWSIVEKDYFLTLLLEGVSEIAALKGSLVFKGGTALRKTYLRDYRYSEDLDFTFRKPLEADEIHGALESALEYLREEHNADFRIRDFDSKPHFTDVKVQFVGLNGGKNTVAFDLSADEIIVEEPHERKIYNPYYGKAFSVYVYPLEEIVAEKMRSLLQRTRVRDYYDLWYLLTKKKKELDGGKIRAIFLKKVEYKKIRFAGKEQLLDSEKLGQAEAYYARQLGGQTKGLPSFEKICKELDEAIGMLVL